MREHYSHVVVLKCVWGELSLQHPVALHIDDGAFTVACLWPPEEFVWPSISFILNVKAAAPFIFYRLIPPLYPEHLLISLHLLFFLPLSPRIRILVYFLRRNPWMHLQPTCLRVPSWGFSSADYAGMEGGSCNLKGGTRRLNLFTPINSEPVLSTVQLLTNTHLIALCDIATCY